MLKTTLFLASSGGVLSVMRFGRNVLLARLIGVEDFGIASTFALLMAMIELLSDLGIRAFIVQNRDGDRPGFLAAVQGLALLRGVALSALILALADPIAVLLGQPGLGWAYRFLALIPLMRAVVHLDLVRQQRAMRFGPSVKVEFTSVAASLAALWPLWFWLGDFRVMLGILIVETAAILALTHLLAERSFRLGWNGAVVLQALRFGWPLLTGGVMIFAIMQGERLIVANQYTGVELGLFSAALTLAMTPTLLVERVVGSTFLPLLSRQQDNKEAFLHKAELAFETLLAVGLGMMLVYVLAGPAAMRLVYGPDFAAGAPLVAILGTSFCLRVIRAAPSNVAMARGHTADLLFPTAVRFASFPVAFLIAVRGGSLEAIALTSVAGDAAALLVAYAVVGVRERLGPVLARRAPLFAIALVLALLLTAMAAGLVAGPVPAIAAAVLLLVVVALCRRFLDYLGGEFLKLRARKA